MKYFIATCVLFVIFLCSVAIQHNFVQHFGTKCGVEEGSNLIYRNPWLVYLEFYRHKHITGMRCGGTLLNSKHVITAAHCVHNRKKYSRVVARFGEYDTSLEEDCLQEICADPTLHVDVADIFVHPEYVGSEHDVAVLRLKENVPYTDFIRPICLPSGTLEEDVTFTAVGWGEVPFTGQYSNTKKIVPLPYWNVNKCQSAYPNTKLPAKVICAGGEEGIDTCRGDSGGPLMLIRDNVELWGVTSAGNVNCGSEGSPGIYTSVMDNLDWINSQISS